MNQASEVRDLDTNHVTAELRPLKARASTDLARDSQTLRSTFPSSRLEFSAGIPAASGSSCEGKKRSLAANCVEASFQDMLAYFRVARRVL